jgi:alpha-galactosidase
VRPVKIAIIGAGSTSFALSSLASLLREPALRGSTLALVDVDPGSLCLVKRLAQRINQVWDAGLTIEATVDRRAALKGAEFVVCAIEVVPREGLWRQDWEIPLRHGIRQPRAENGGPGGFAHAARNIPLVLDLARDMEMECPRALLIMLSNPLPRLCRAVTKYSTIEVVGLCHQIGFAYGLAGVALCDRTDVEVPGEILEPDPPPYPYNSAYWSVVGKFLLAVSEAISIKAAGLNHFSWILDIRDRRTGEDLYPILRERFLAFSLGPQRLTREMLQLTGYMPVPGDSHLAEYVGWVHNAVTKPWERYGLQPYEWERATCGRSELRRHLEELGDGWPLEELRGLPSEGIPEIVLGVTLDSHVYRPAVNVPNDGAIANLPSEAIVELPAVVTASGPTPLQVGDLPPMVAELCRREAELVEFVVDAAVRGSRELALQALALDPTVDDLCVARAALDELLAVHSRHLPQFNGLWEL